MPPTQTSPAGDPGAPGRWRSAAPGFLIVLLTLAAYAPAMRAGFIWDDPDYVTENELLRSLDGLGRIWAPGNTPQYYPLVFTSFWIEYHLWELHPLGYHLTNILLHAFSAIMVWRLLLRLRVPAAWLCAAVFAVHPVHVESVAWITERKNVLSVVFYLLSLRAYLRFDRSRRAGLYFAALALFVAALLSKTVTSSLPVALLLIIWYRRGRPGAADLLNLLPYFIIGLALSLLTIWLERHHVGARGVDWELSLPQRVLIAGRALWFYAATLLWPARLTFIYPRWDPDPTRLAEWLAPLSAIAALLGLWVMRRRWGRGPLAAVLFFVVSLLPALGFVDVFPFRYSFVADHFQYLASLGIIILVVGGLGRVFTAVRAAPWKTFAHSAAAVALILLGMLTARQCTVYKDAETLYRDTLAKNPDAWMAHFNLGLILDRRGESDNAHRHYLETVRLRPQHHKAHTLLARDYTKAGDIDRAIEHYRAALDVEPGLLTANINLGNIYASRGEYQRAIRHYHAALATRSPLPEANFALGNALAAMGDYAGAAEQYRIALSAGPDDGPTRANLGTALLQLGRLGEAVAEFQAAVDLDPNLIETRLLLAAALSRAGHYVRAADTLRAGLGSAPSDTRLTAALAWMLCTCPDDAIRDGHEAVALAERLVAGTRGTDAAALRTLAAAYAEVGRFNDAIHTARLARDHASADNNQRLVQQIDRQITAFESRRPYRAGSAD